MATTEHETGHERERVGRRRGATGRWLLSGRAAPGRSSGRPGLGLVLLAVATLAASISPRAARAVETCDASLCAGNPCTITGRHLLPPVCTLDWSGRDVVIAPGARLLVRKPGARLAIRTGSLRVEGLIETRGGELSLSATGNLAIAGAVPGGWVRLRGARRDLASALTLHAGNALTVGGKGVAAYSGGLLTSIEARTVEITSELGADSHSWAGEFSLRATAGDLVASAPVHARIRGVDGIGNAVVAASGDVRLDGPLSGAGGSHPILRVEAGRDLIATGSISADGLRDEEVWGGDLYLVAQRHVVLTGPVSARSPGVLGKGGTITILGGPTGDVTIEAPVDASSNDQAHGRDGAILVGPACDVRIAAELRAGGSTGEGEISLGYRNSLDLAGGSLVSVASPSEILCRCSGGNGICTGPCAPPPAGAGTAVFDPAPTFRPVGLPACAG